MTFQNCTFSCSSTWRGSNVEYPYVPKLAGPGWPSCEAEDDVGTVTLMPPSAPLILRNYG